MAGASSTDSDQGKSFLHELKADPGRASIESVIEEIEKLRRVRERALPTDLFAHVSPRVLHLYRQRAATEKPSELRSHTQPVRATLTPAP